MSYEGPSPRASRLAVALWPLALLTYAHTVFLALDAPYSIDYRVIYRGARHFLTGHSVYTDIPYVFPPSGALLTAPLGWLGPGGAHTAIVLVGAVCTPIAGALGLRLMGRQWTGALGAGVLLALGLSETVTHTLKFGNINTLLALLETAALLLQVQRRDMSSGAVLGLALAFKPVMGLLLLIPLLGRRWRAVAAAVVVPVVLNLIGYAVGPFQREFFTVTIPNLVHARPNNNSSLWAAGEFLGWNDVLVLVLRVGCVALGVVVVWKLRHEEDERLRLGLVSGSLLLMTFLASSLSEMYWSVLLLPLLLTVVLPRSPMHSWLAWVGVYLFLSLDTWIPRNQQAIGQDFERLRVVLGWGLLLAVSAVWAVREPRVAPAVSLRPIHRWMRPDARPQSSAARSFSTSTPSE